MSIEDTLKQRGNVHGDFTMNSIVVMGMIECMMSGTNWDTMPSDHKNALIYIAGKMSRIVCGDSEFSDHWHDIIGYATLIEEKLNSQSPT